jgi:peptidoglycan hydrolase-like protein with peptidoglycan-binding domain
VDFENFIHRMVNAMKTKINQPEAKNQSFTPFFANANRGGFLGVQTKLESGQPGDQYEAEADRVADILVSQTHGGVLNISGNQNQHFGNNLLPETISSSPKGDEMQDDELRLTGQTIEEPNLEEKIKNSQGSGQKLDAVTRSYMETGFGTDFSRVNIHTDATAVQLSSQLGAEAFAHGNDIYFNEGRYNPGSNNGKHLLAHELTHTIQQTGRISANLQYVIGDNHDLASPRFAGDPVLEACFDNERFLQQGSNGPAVASIQQALIDAGFPLPQFGADGSFGRETRSALQDFQRASGLVPDGIVGSGTMSALDALFSGGAPALPPAIPVVPPPATAPTVTSQTIVAAPDGTADTRTTVGVGERIRFTGDSAGTWTASEGQIIGINNGSNVIWEAPAVAATPTITLTTPGGQTATQMTVVAPDSLDMAVAANDPIAVETAGACMFTNVTANPLNVSFGRTQWLEVPGPATNVSGYFTRFSAVQLRHHPNPRYLPFNDLNAGLNDHAAFHEAPAPFSFGTFDWVIPNRYKIDGESDAQGRFFVDTTQEFSIFADGTMMIDKSGGFVMRTIANVVT